MSINSVEPLFSVARRVEHVLFSRVFWARFMFGLALPWVEAVKKALLHAFQKGFCSGIICPIGFWYCIARRYSLFKCSLSGVFWLSVERGSAELRDGIVVFQCNLQHILGRCVCVGEKQAMDISSDSAFFVLAGRMSYSARCVNLKDYDCRER